MSLRSRDTASPVWADVCKVEQRRRIAQLEERPGYYNGEVAGSSPALPTIFFCSVPGSSATPTASSTAQTLRGADGIRDEPMLG